MHVRIFDGVLTLGLNTKAIKWYLTVTFIVHIAYF